MTKSRPKGRGSAAKPGQSMKITRPFYNRNTVDVAKDLLGKFLFRKLGKIEICAQIIETEAYRGESDLACHAARGRTKRTEIMYGEPGHAYIYLCYGMHWMLNIVTEKKDFPAAVLIRSLEPKTYNLKPDLSGPGKLTKNLNIDGKLNGEDLTQSNKIWIEDRGVKVKKSGIISSPRIGVAYAKHCAIWPWRFYLK